MKKGLYGVNGERREQGGLPSRENVHVAIAENVVSAVTAQTIGWDAVSLGRLALPELAAAWAACGLFEWVAVGYLAASSVLILLFAENLAHPFRLIGTQGFVCALILLLCRVEVRAAEEARLGGE